ncbi:MAG TPA: GNAT family N-acetyltransferase [Candidatus Dormibacteraeota bacterium]
MLPGAAGELVAAMGGEGELAGLRFDRGCRCFAVFAGEEVAGYGWLSNRAEWIGEIRLEIRPKPAEAYIWNCLTLPAHRRKGMFRAVVVSISTVLQAEGIERLWIASGGGGAEKALSDAGFQPVLLVEESRLGFAGLRVLRADEIPAADRSLASAARQVLEDGGRPLRPPALARRPGVRRH